MILRLSKEYPTGTGGNVEPGIFAWIATDGADVEHLLVGVDAMEHNPGEKPPTGTGAWW